MKNLLILLFIFISGNAYSEPSSTFRYLMNEPLTMFDWGVYKLQKYTDSFEFTGLNLIKAYTYADYDDIESKLLIEATVYPHNESLSIVPAERLCEKVFTQIRNKFGLKHEKTIREGTFNISRFFEHRYYAGESKPLNFMSDIESETVVKVKVFASENDDAPFHQVGRCEGGLLIPMPL